MGPKIKVGSVWMKTLVITIVGKKSILNSRSMIPKIL